METKTRPSMVGIRVSAEERRTIEALAQKLERNMSDAVRYVVRQAARELLLPEDPTGANEKQASGNASEVEIDCQRR